MNQAYQLRIVDGQLDRLLGGLPAVCLEGPRAVGKTSTALQRARTIYDLDDPETVALIAADPDRLVRGDAPIFIDEWQRYPPSWDLVRRAVDRGAGPGSFLLAGSASPETAPTHSGAGRIVTLRMRPMSLFERGAASPSVSLAQLLAGGRPDIGAVFTNTPLTITPTAQPINNRRPYKTTPEHPPQTHNPTSETTHRRRTTPKLTNSGQITRAKS